MCKDYQEDHVGLHLWEGEQPYCLFWGKLICVLGLNCPEQGKPPSEPEPPSAKLHPISA